MQERAIFMARWMMLAAVVLKRFYVTPGAVALLLS